MCPSNGPLFQFDVNCEETCFRQLKVATSALYFYVFWVLGSKVLGSRGSLNHNKISYIYLLSYPSCYIYSRPPNQLKTDFFSVMQHRNRIEHSPYCSKPQFYYRFITKYETLSRHLIE